MGESMGLKVMYFDVEPKLPLGNAQAVETLEELYAKSDIISLHVPATPQTKNMIGEAAFAQMKDGVIFQNLARGTVVDIEALKNAILSGKVGGAAVDVFPTEPKQNGIGFESALVGLNNVILTPHVGGSTQEAQENIGIEVGAKLTSYLDNGSTLGSKSVPELSLAPQNNTRRVLHFHKNVPGVLSDINSILSKHNVNILAQYLKTNESIGYVVLDVDANADMEMMDDLKLVNNTIKTRILY
jgi:D-3-phosphoglycerate dehydrogenase